MGSCYSCNCFHSQRHKIMQEQQQEMEQLVQNGKRRNADKLQNDKDHQKNENNDDEDEDGKFSLNTIRKQRDEYDSFMIISFINTSISSQQNISEKIIELIKQYTPQTKILLIETGQTEELSSDKHHIFHSIIINRDATLTTNPWNPNLQKGGTLLITCIASINMRENASICLNSKGYKGGHCTYIEDDQFIDNIHDDESEDEEHQFYQHQDDEEQSLNGLYASYSGESYKGLRSANSTKNNFGGGGAGRIWGSGGGAGYGTVGFRGQYDKQYSNKSCGKGGDIYGSNMLNILYLGSGGGASYGGYNGGDGGGALKIECKNLLMDKGCIISCNGGNGAHKYLSGSGSGGSLHLIIENGNDIQLHSTARIQAIGGEKKELYGYGYKSDDVANCGRGGYGRIRIQTCVNGDKLKKKLKNEYKFCIEPIPYIG